MDIVIIGSGNVATVLGKKIKAAGHNIVQVVGRNSTTASALAYELNTESTNYMTLLNRNADIYIIAVSDAAIEKVISDLQLPGKVIVHTAAAVSKDVLQNVSPHYGVFYPLQSLRKEMPELPDVPVYFDASDDVAKSKLDALARSISVQVTEGAGQEERIKLHVAAVVVSNFVNHLYVLAEEYCKKEGIPFKQLIPLIEETADRVKTISPKDSQTGPAIRRDQETIHKHLEILQSHPHLKNIYVLLTESIQQTPS